MPMKLDTWDFDINKVISRLKKKKIKIITCPPHPGLPGIPVMVNSKGCHKLPVAPENGLPPINGDDPVADADAFSGSLGDFSGVDAGAGIGGGDVGGGAIGGGGIGESVEFKPHTIEGMIKELSKRGDTKSKLTALILTVASKLYRFLPREQIIDIATDVLSYILNHKTVISNKFKAQSKYSDFNDYLSAIVTNRLRLGYQEMTAEEKNLTRHGSDDKKIIKFIVDKYCQDNNTETIPDAETIHEENKHLLFDENNNELISALVNAGLIKENETREDIADIIKLIYQDKSLRQNFSGYYVPGNRLLSVKVIQKILDAIDASDVKSLDLAFDNDEDKDLSLLDQIADPSTDDEEANAQRTELLKNVFINLQNILDDDAFEIFCDLFGLDPNSDIESGLETTNRLSISEIADKYGYSRYHARLICASLLEKAQKYFKNYKI